MDKLNIYARKTLSDSVIDFENVEELRLFDLSYISDTRSDILNVISTTFGVSQQEIIGIRTLNEGMINDSFLFEVDDTKYVFRTPGKGTELLMNRAQEYDVYQVVSPLKTSDEIIYINANSGYKISKFIHNSRTLDPSNHIEIKEALSILKAFHQKDLKVNHEFDIEERIAFYHDLCVKTDAAFFEDFDEVHQLIKKVQSD